MLLVCVSTHLKSVLGYKFLILDAYRPDTLWLGEQECDYVENIAHSAC